MVSEDGLSYSSSGLGQIVVKIRSVSLGFSVEVGFKEVRH
jgi:hypothetical protein